MRFISANRPLTLSIHFLYNAYMLGLITKKQKEVLDFISEYTSSHEYAPSLEEIASYFDLASVSTAHHHVEALEGLGYLKKIDNHPRALEVVQREAVAEPVTQNISLKFNSDRITKTDIPVNQIVHGDVMDFLKKMPDASVDLIVADPPYNLSQGGNWSWSGAKGLQGFGGKWSKVMENWDNMPLQDYFSFTLAWLTEAKRVLKPSGSIWIFGTYHNTGIINVAFQILEIEIINEIVWYKRNAFPNLSGRRFTASHETLLWGHVGGKKRKYYFDYPGSKAWFDSSDQIKKQDKQMRTVWDIPNNKERRELQFGKHPTQKPLSICKRIVSLSSKENDLVVSPFAGVGSECLAAAELNRRYIGIELDEAYVDIAKKRLDNAQKVGKLF